MTEPGLVARLDLAIVAPRSALAIAGDRRNAGRSGGDLLVALLVLLVATELRGLAAAVWLASAVDLGFGARAALAVISRAVAIDLVVLVIAALVVWIASGPRRELARAFDLACVAVLPLVVVAIVATAIVRALAIDVPDALALATAGVAYAWTGALVALAARVARRASPPVQAPPRARRAGLAFAAVATLAVALHAVWIARNTDMVRPMVQGDRAPELALPAIGPGGARGAAVMLPAGKPVVIDFWATWCGPCLRALPHLDAFARAHPDVAVIAVNVDDAAEARAIFDDHHLAPVLVADDGLASQRYGVTSYPHTVVIDRAGFVRQVSRGATIDLDAALAAMR